MIVSTFIRDLRLRFYKQFHKIIMSDVFSGLSEKSKNSKVTI